tara:strand:+ start:1487 stop:1975 length:489 start_codon:yes stop_codon:yes gene_type:complete
VNLIRRIGQLNVSQLFSFAGLFLKHPMYLVPTLRATKRTMTLCNDLFKNDHHRSNRANAFRHALWNIVIAQNCFKRNKNKEKSLIFTQKFTNLYEKVTQNKALEEAMDLHNNEMGLRYFSEEKEKKVVDWIDFLLKTMKNAQKVEEIGEIQKLPENLVFLEE